MKKCTAFLLALLLCASALLCTACGPDEFPTVNLSFELAEDKSGYIVTGIGKTKDTTVNIPEQHLGKPVIGIGDDAFKYYSAMTSLVIPESVTSIGNRAFIGCTGLTEIVLPASVTSIGEYAFIRCEDLTIYCVAKEQPASWDPDWNPHAFPVIWDCYKQED